MAGPSRRVSLLALLVVLNGCTTIHTYDLSRPADRNAVDQHRTVLIGLESESGLRGLWPRVESDSLLFTDNDSSTSEQLCGVCRRHSGSETDTTVIKAIALSDVERAWTARISGPRTMALGFMIGAAAGFGISYHLNESSSGGDVSSRDAGLIGAGLFGLAGIAVGAIMSSLDEPPVQLNLVAPIQL